MKHLRCCLLLITLLSTPFIAFSQTYLWEEDFNPAHDGWVLQDNWSMQTGNMYFSWTPTITNYSLSATSPVINLPDNAGDLFVTQYATYFSYIDEAFEIAILHGNEVDVLWTHTGPNNWGTFGGSLLTLSLVPYQNQNIQIRFRSYGSSTYNTDGWWIYHIGIEGAFDDDLEALSISGNTTPSVNMPTDYTVTIRNAGSNDQTEYSVKLMRQGGIELLSLPGLPIDAGAVMDYVLTWSPTEVGPTYIYGEVVLVGDEVPENNTTPNLHLSVQGQGTVAITIGNDTTTDYSLPLNFYWRNSLSQTIYMASELNVGGLLTGIVYYNNFVTNLPNMPVNIWVGETTLDNLSAGWIPSTDLQLVYSGSIDFPAGANDITIPFTNYYVYNGNNIVIMAQRPMDTTFYNFSDHFYFSATNFPDRSRNLQSDSIHFDPENPTGGTLTNRVPNTTLFFLTAGMGSLEGHVYDQATNNPLAGAEVEILNTNYSTVTNANGFYSFPFVPEGTHDVQASIFGYHTLVMEDVLIEEDETTTLNFNLTQLDNVTVSGQVVGSDFPAIGLENAAVSLTGYDNYNTVTGANGLFSIPGVYSNQTYSISINAEGYSLYTGEVAVGNVDLDLGIVIVDEIAFPPLSLIATQSPDDDYVDLIWNMPTTVMGTEQWFYWGTGTNPTNNGIGTGAAVQFSVAQRFTPVNIEDLDIGGLHVTVVRIWPRESVATYTVKIWQGGGSNPWNAGTVMHSQVATGLVYGQWNDVVLTNPVLINPAQEIWIGYDVDTPAGHPAGCDPGPAIDGYGNMMFWSNQWSTLLEIAPTLSYNWCIQAYAGTARGERDVLFSHQQLHSTISSQSAGLRNTRALEGYEVYRFLTENQDNEDLWTDLATINSPTDTTYTDLSWDNVASGFYRYAVKGRYTNDVLSPPRISNWVGKDMTTNVTVNVTIDVGDSADGATVSFFYQDQDPDGISPVYTQHTEGDDPATTTFWNILRGNYNLEVSKPGYTTYTQSNIDIQIPTVFDIELEEIPYPPSNLIYSAGNNLVSLSWDAPNPDLRSTDSGISEVPGHVRIEEQLRERGITDKELLASEMRIIIDSQRSDDNDFTPFSLQNDDNSRNRALLGYNVYRDGVQINTETIEVTTYNDTTVDNNVTYIYYVTAVYTMSESVPSNSVTVVPGPNQLIQIGTDTTSGYFLPLNFWYRCSLTQTIYMAEELNIGGVITQIQYYNTFSTNLPNMPVQIWMGETEQNNLTDGWIPSTQLELVFDGNVNFPPGQNTIEIELDEFFFYSGSQNIAILAKRPMDTQWYSSLDHFYFSATPQYPNRSRHLFSDSIDYDPTAPTGGTLSHNVPNTGFYVVTVGMGSLDGHVHDQNNQPMHGAMITVADTDFVQHTNIQGYYLFPFMYEGTHTVTASKFGYYDGVVENVIIEEYEMTTVDFTLNPLPTVTLSGRVVGSDQPDVGLENAFIILEGYDYYETNGDENGLFSIPGVYADHTYTMTVQRGGYSTLTMEVAVGDTDLDLGDVVVNELAFPPFDVIATLSNDNTEAYIEWVSPDEYDFVDFRYDDGVPTIAIGLPDGTNNSILGAVHRRSAILNSVSWYTGGTTPHAAVNVFIFGLNAQGTPNSNVVLYQAASVPNNHQQWTVHELPEEIEAPDGFLIGLSVMGNLGIGGDDGVGDPYHFQNNTHYYTSNYTTGSWATMESAGYTNNFLLRAQGFDLGPIRSSEPPLSQQRYEITHNIQSVELLSPYISVNSQLGAKESTLRPDISRILMGFIVYRLEAGQEGEQNLWSEIGTIPATQTDFTDTGLPELYNGLYRYAVRSVYTNNVLSLPALSNTINYEEQIPHISNLEAEVIDGDVHLTWQWAPRETDEPLIQERRTISVREHLGKQSVAKPSRSSHRVFEGFKITRNGPVIAEGIMEPNYIDEALEPGSYTYTIIGEFTNGSTNMLHVIAIVPLDADDVSIEPLITRLIGNHPNPFNPDTIILYSLEQDNKVTIEIYNIRGQLIRTLVDENQKAGSHSVVWNGMKDNGRPAGSGIFFYRMKSGFYSSTRKMIMIK